MSPLPERVGRRGGAPPTTGRRQGDGGRTRRGGGPGDGGARVGDRSGQAPRRVSSPVPPPPTAASSSSTPAVAEAAELAAAGTDTVAARATVAVAVATRHRQLEWSRHRRRPGLTVEAVTAKPPESRSSSSSLPVHHGGQRNRRLQCSVRVWVGWKGEKRAVRPEQARSLRFLSTMPVALLGPTVASNVHEYGDYHVKSRGEAALLRRWSKLPFFATPEVFRPRTLALREAESYLVAGLYDSRRRVTIANEPA